MDGTDDEDTVPLPHNRILNANGHSSALLRIIAVQRKIYGN